MKKLISAVLISAMLISLLFVMPATVSAESDDGLPDAVDLSQSKYFPPVKSQGDQGSCVAWAQAYYQFTYEMNKSLDRESTEENLFSPSFAYNMANYGEDSGCFPKTVFTNLQRIGVTTWNTIPYNKEVHRDWFAEESIWQEASKYRISEYKTLPNFRTGSGKHVEHPDDPDLTQIKSLLSEGTILTFGAYIYRWKEDVIKSNPACPANDPYVGEKVVLATSPDIGTGYGHRMTLVGYNDNMWVDINKNDKIDKGEMGAFKVANSFGPWWGNDGFVWLAYDNINMTTAVEGGLPYRTMSGMVDVTEITVRPYASDSDLYIRYTLNTCDRQNLTVTVTAEKNGEKTEVIAGPYHEAPYAKNIYSFDGTTESNDGTMIFMLSNVIPDITRETVNDYKWSISFKDAKADGKVLTVKNAELVDLATNRSVKAEGSFGYTLDGSERAMDFGKLPEYVPPVTTAAEAATAQTATAQPYTSEATTATTVTDATEITTATVTASAPVSTAPVTTETVPETETSSVYTDPAETATETEVIVTIPTPAQSQPLTESTTATLTEAIETTAAFPAEAAEYLYGDTNLSSNISISDATLIQKYIACMVGEDKICLANADCNGDGKVSIKDATCIQKYLAKLEGFGVTGEKYTVNIPADTTTQITTEALETTLVTEAVTTAIITETVTVITTEASAPTATTEATEATTEAATEVIIPTQTTPQTVPETTIATEATEAEETTAIEVETTAVPTEIVTEPETTEATEATEPLEVNVVTFTNSHNWQGTISCYYWSDSNKAMTSWPGEAMENAGTNTFGQTLYTMEIPEDAAYVIFTNGSAQTVDIPYVGGEQKFYPLTETDSQGHFNVSLWE